MPEYDDVPDSALPQEGQSTPAPAEGQAAPEGQQAQAEPQQAAQPGTGQQAPTSWNGQEYAIKFRNKEIVPESREKLINWAQLGYSYNTRAEQLKQREAEIEAAKGQYSQYEQLATYMQQNPAFQKDFMDLYYRHAGGAQATQQGQPTPGQTAPDGSQYLSPLMEKYQSLESRLQTYEQQQADQGLQREIDGLKGKYARQDWDAPDDQGATLMHEVMQNAYRLGGVSLETAYRDMMFDQSTVNAKAEALKAEAINTQKAKQAGVVAQGGTVPKVAPRSFDHKKLNYDEIAEEALRGVR